MQNKYFLILSEYFRVCIPFIVSIYCFLVTCHGIKISNKSMWNKKIYMKYFLLKANYLVYTRSHRPVNSSVFNLLISKKYLTNAILFTYIYVSVIWWGRGERFVLYLLYYEKQSHDKRQKKTTKHFIPKCAIGRFAPEGIINTVHQHFCTEINIFNIFFF